MLCWCALELTALQRPTETRAFAVSDRPVAMNARHTIHQRPLSRALTIAVGCVGAGVGDVDQI